MATIKTFQSNNKYTKGVDRVQNFRDDSETRMFQGIGTLVKTVAPVIQKVADDYEYTKAEELGNELSSKTQAMEAKYAKGREENLLLSEMGIDHAEHGLNETARMSDLTEEQARGIYDKERARILDGRKTNILSSKYEKAIISRYNEASTIGASKSQLAQSKLRYNQNLEVLKDKASADNRKSIETPKMMGDYNYLNDTMNDAMRIDKTVNNDPATKKNMVEENASTKMAVTIPHLDLATANRVIRDIENKESSMHQKTIEIGGEKYSHYEMLNEKVVGNLYKKRDLLKKAQERDYEKKVKTGVESAVRQTMSGKIAIEDEEFVGRLLRDKKNRVYGEVLTNLSNGVKNTKYSSIQEQQEVVNTAVDMALENKALTIEQRDKVETLRKIAIKEIEKKEKILTDNQNDDYVKANSANGSPSLTKKKAEMERQGLVHSEFDAREKELLKKGTPEQRKEVLETALARYQRTQTEDYLFYKEVAEITKDEQGNVFGASAMLGNSYFDETIQQNRSITPQVLKERRAVIGESAISDVRKSVEKEIGNNITSFEHHTAIMSELMKTQVGVETSSLNRGEKSDAVDTLVRQYKKILNESTVSYTESGITKYVPTALVSEGDKLNIPQIGKVSQELVYMAHSNKAVASPSTRVIADRVRSGELSMDYVGEDTLYIRENETGKTITNGAMGLSEEDYDLKAPYKINMSEVLLERKVRLSNEISEFIESPITPDDRRKYSNYLTDKTGLSILRQVPVEQISDEELEQYNANTIIRMRRAEQGTGF